ncbi:hypothetical protein [Celeribacter ethanolicus]|nr:hypothetical protein [Celeribacter ethanolicus]
MHFDEIPGKLLKKLPFTRGGAGFDQAFMLCLPFSHEPWMTLGQKRPR